jgi:hypothetical protein
LRAFSIVEARNVGSFIDYLADFKILFTHTSSSSILGLGLGFDNSSPRSKRSRKIVKSIFNKENIKTHRARYPSEKADEYDKNVIQPYIKKLEDSRLKVYEERAKKSFALNIGYNQEFFSVLSAKSENLPDFDSLNYFGTKSNIFRLSSSFSLNTSQWVFSASANSMNMRKNAEKGQEKIPYFGYSLGINYRVFKFIRDPKKLRENDNYKKSLFIPGVHLGLLFDYLNTDSKEYKFVKDKIIRRQQFSPTLDVLLTPAAQFRFSFPIIKDNTFDGTEKVTLGTTVTYALKLSSLAN